MANRWAVANGNWSATATWNGGTLPTAADDVFANNFTVTIDQNVTALSLRTEAAAGINAGGGFTLSASYDIAADLYSGSSTCVTFSASSPAVTNITGNLYSSTTSTTDLRAFNHTGTGTSNITGNLLGGTGSTGNRRVAARIGAAGTMNINGNVTGNTGATNHGLIVENNGSATITGNLATNGNVAVSISSGSLTVTGTLISGAVNLISASTCNVTVNGNQTLSSSAIASIISHTVSGNLTVNGSVTNNTTSASSLPVVAISGAVNLTVNGAIIQNATGNVNHNVLSIAGSGSHSVVGAITRNSGCNCVIISGGSLVVTGDVSTTFSSNNNAISISGIAVLTINGNITGNLGGATQSGNITSTGSGLITINGNVTGGTATGAPGIVITSISTSNVVVNGTITAGSGSTSQGIYHAGSGTITATKVVGNGYGVGSTGIGEAYAIFNAVAATIFGEIIVQEFEFGSRGAVPVRGFCRIANSSSRVARFRDSSGTQISLVDPSTLVTPPAVTDVRSGVVYNNGNLTGTLAVPPVNQVAAGIAVGNTVGTAVLTQANVWDYALSSASSVAGSVGEKLKKTAIPADIIALS